MKSISIGLRIVEIILFILLIQGAFVAVVALLGILFAVISLSLTGILEAVAALIALPLLIVPGIVLWFWFRVPNPTSRFRIILSLSGLAIWLALLGFGNVFALSLGEEPLSNTEFVKSVLLNPAFLNSVLCQFCLLYIGFSQSAKEFYSEPGADPALD